MAMEASSRVYPVSAGQYKLFEEIGCSPSSTVYRALCLLFNEVVAIKTLDLESSSVNLDDIRREAQTMRLSNHVNLVKAHCSFMVDRSVWVVMPYLSGGSCLHIMKAAFQEGFEEPVIATILKESLKALEYLHRQGLIHRDVKAGNILLDGDGSVKLGDFGVSASMFETGDRQRSRTTFVGTPCWMAPEVIEKLHGYDFKADIWSFGITALELAHGHAPFSKYPPMKVLLMTLQNNPPGLDYERDKRFSKSFKEMIAMCLVKEPTKRPSAERLLRHSFFKGARSPDYIYRHVLEGLPPLGERVKQLRLLDNARLAQKKMPLSEQEQKSQSEYQKGVSGWNFNVEDLKAQAAALIADDDDHGGEDEPHHQHQHQHGFKGSPEQNIRHSVIHHDASNLSHDTGQQLQPPVTLHIVKVESAAIEGGERITRVRSGPLPAPGSHSKPTNGQRPLASKKEPKHIGRFDVFEDDTDVEEQGTRRPNDKDRSREDSHHRDHRRHDLERERDKEHRQGGRVASSGSLVLDQRPTNGLQASMRASSVNKEGGEEKSKSTQKAPVVQRGRFSVTSDDVSVVEDAPHGRRRTPSSEGLQQQQQQGGGVNAANAASNSATVTVPVVAVIPHLQNALNHAVMQQEALLHVLNSINPSEASTQSRMLKHSRSSSFYMGSHHSSMGEIASDRERDLIQQIADLQSKSAVLADELQALKHKNVLLERQLNAHYNREEEERIRQEEAANDDS